MPARKSSRKPQAYLDLSKMSDEQRIVYMGGFVMETGKPSEFIVSGAEKAAQYIERFKVLYPLITVARVIVGSPGPGFVTVQIDPPIKAKVELVENDRN